MFKIQSPEDQVKFILPLNRDTEHLGYNTRLIIDAPVLTEPRAWLLSKVNRTVSKGIAMYTAAQDTFNQHTDVPFYDESGNVLYWVADWKQSKIAPEEITSSDPTSLLSSITSKITYSGTSSQIKVGGSKMFTVSFYDDDQPVEHEIGEWSFLIDNEDITDQLSLSYPAENKAKVKIPNNDELVGKILTIVNTSGDVVSSTEVELIAL